MCEGVMLGCVLFTVYIFQKCKLLIEHRNIHTKRTTTKMKPELKVKE